MLEFLYQAEREKKKGERIKDVCVLLAESHVGILYVCRPSYHPIGVCFATRVRLHNSCKHVSVIQFVKCK
jgi:hypothetical protein